MKILYLILILFFNYSLPYSGSSYRFSNSARSHSIANASVADDYNTFQSFSNPGSLSHTTSSSYGLSYFKLSLNRSIQVFYFSKNLPGNAGLSIGLMRTGVDGFMGKDSFNNSTNELSAADYYGLLSFGLKGFGISMKMHYSNLYIDDEHSDKYSGNSIVVDLGYLLKINQNWSFGLKLENLINSNLNWDIDIGDGLSHSYQEKYPLIIATGSSYSLNENHLLLIQYDKIIYNNFEILESRFGYEFNGFKSGSLRFGLSGKKDFRFGGSYNFVVNDKYPIVIDYSLDLGSENEGISHLFTWSYKL